MLREGKVAILVLGFFLLLTSSRCWAADQAGYLLVDKLVFQFNQMANSPEVSYEQVNGALKEMMGLARKAKAEQRIDVQFFERYARILRIIKLVITEDQEHILAPVTGPVCASFVKDVTGKTVDGEANLSVTAQAITKELENLKKYLDQR